MEEAMRKVIFTIIAFCAVAGAASAQQVALQPGESLRIALPCVDVRGKQYPPVAVADADGVVRLATGHVIRGYPPHANVCGNFPLRRAREFKCRELRLEETRCLRFCNRGAIAGRTCRHLVCD